VSEQQSLFPEPDSRGEEILRLIIDRDAHNPITIREIREATGIGVREIKELVRELVMVYHQPIVGRRGAPCGYYYATTAADIEQACKPLHGELVALARRIHAIAGPKRLREWLGQMRIEELN